MRDHLGPVLRAEQPGVKIIGFDHNKDHVVDWAKGLYADPAAAQYFDGIGVHWYGGLNVHNLNNAHAVAPHKFLLATEACNCPGVVYRAQTTEWWQRAEHIGMDILEDLLHWTTGWTDWNLILDTTGGPNHLGNRCDANLIADPKNKMGYGTIVMQASFYYMGHFSRYFPPGSRRVGLLNDVVPGMGELGAKDITSGSPLVFAPCLGNELQAWTLDHTKSLFVERTRYQCIDISNYGAGPRLDTFACAHSANQQWERRIIPQCTAHMVAALGVACSQLVNPASGQCLTKVTTSGAAIGLDAGTTMVVAQAQPCLPPGAPSQTFDLVNGDQSGFPKAFPIRSPVDNGDSDRELCLQPWVAKDPTFDAVAFATPNGSVALVAMNRGDEALGPFDLFDEQLGAGVQGISLPPHSIQSYVLPAAPAAAAMGAHAATDVDVDVDLDAASDAAGARGQQPSGGAAATAAATVTLLADDRADALPSADGDGSPAASGASAAFVAAAALVAAAAAFGRRALRQHGAHLLLRKEEETDAWEAATTAVEPVDAVGSEQPYALMHGGEEGRD